MYMYVKILKTFILTCCIAIFSLNCALSDEHSMLKTGISINGQVPSAFFGTWRVASFLIDTNSPSNFKKNNLDIWNLSKENDVIYLRNPFSGANASITLSYAKNNSIRFIKQSNYEGKILTDTVELYIDGDSFSGVNTILLETLSDVDNSVIKSAKATYTLKGEKIAGRSIGD